MYIIVYDFGTSSVKTCLFDIDSEIRLVTSSAEKYGLYTSDDGGAEQDTGGGGQDSGGGADGGNSGEIIQ